MTLASYRRAVKGEAPLIECNACANRRPLPVAAIPDADAAFPDADAAIPDTDAAFPDADVAFPDADAAIPDADAAVPDADAAIPDADAAVPDADAAVPDVDYAIPDADATVPDPDVSVTEELPPPLEESALADPPPGDHDSDNQTFTVEYTVVDSGSQKGKPKLADNRGFSYCMWRSVKNGTAGDALKEVGLSSARPLSDSEDPSSIVVLILTTTSLRLENKYRLR